MVLDAAVALTALGVLLEILVALTVGAADGLADLLLTVGYPAIAPCSSPRAWSPSRASPRPLRGRRLAAAVLRRARRRDGQRRARGRPHLAGPRRVTSTAYLAC